MWKEPAQHIDLRLKGVLKAAVEVVDEANKWKETLRKGDEDLSNAIIALESRLRAYGCYTIE